ncbi:MAG: low molecular weight protein-tyrosine-phosphatase [Bacteroidota bacterium]
MKVKVIFVCLGNICRSPLAAAVFEEMVKKAGLENEFEIDSAGTSDYHIGESPDQRTLENAAKHGLVINNKGRQISRKDLINFDYIVAMDGANLKNIQKLDQTHQFATKMFLMRDFDSIEKKGDVPDPYFGGEEGFENVYNIVKRSMENFLKELIKIHNLPLAVKQ